MTNRWGYKTSDGRELVVYRETREQAAAALKTDVDARAPGGDPFDEKKIKALPTLAEESRRAAKVEDRRKAPGA